MLRKKPTRISAVTNSPELLGVISRIAIIAAVISAVISIAGFLRPRKMRSKTKPPRTEPI